MLTYAYLLAGALGVLDVERHFVAGEKIAGVCCVVGKQHVGLALLLYIVVYEALSY
jgi:hypothetical protein